MTTTVLGAVRVVGILALSATLLGKDCWSGAKAWWAARSKRVSCIAGEKKEFTAKMSVGSALALAGVCLYGHARLVASGQLASAEVPDTFEHSKLLGQPELSDDQQAEGGGIEMADKREPAGV